MNRWLQRLQDRIRVEPAIVRSTLAAAAVLLAVFGLEMSEDQVAALSTLALLAAGVSTRHRVVPVAKPRRARRRQEAGLSSTDLLVIVLIVVIIVLLL